MFLSEVVEVFGDGIKTRHSPCRNVRVTEVDPILVISLRADSRTSTNKCYIQSIAEGDPSARGASAA